MQESIGFCMTSSNSTRKIVLFIYTPLFNSYGWRMKLGEFYAGKMKADVLIEYVSLDYRSRAEEDYGMVFEIKSKVQEAIRRAFGDKDI